MRLGADNALSDRLKLSASLGYEERRYGGQDPLFLIGRRDRQLDARVGLAYALTPQWILAPQLTYTDNRSNVELNRYTRTVAFVALRYAF
jgi:hypothetical protein